MIGTKHAGAYCREMGVKLKVEKNRNIYRFGEDQIGSVDSINTCIPTPIRTIMLIKTDLVKEDVPFLIDLIVIDFFGLYVDTA